MRWDWHLTWDGPQVSVGGFWVVAWLAVGVAYGAWRWHTTDEARVRRLATVLHDQRVVGDPGWILALVVVTVVVGLNLMFSIPAWPAAMIFDARHGGRADGGSV